MDVTQISQIGGLAGEPELVLFLSIGLDLMVRADPTALKFSVKRPILGDSTL